MCASTLIAPVSKKNRVTYKRHQSTRPNINNFKNNLIDSHNFAYLKAMRGGHLGLNGQIVTKLAHWERISMKPSALKDQGCVNGQMNRTRVTIHVPLRFMAMRLLLRWKSKKRNAVIRNVQVRINMKIAFTI